MKTLTFTAIAETAYGKAIEPIKYTGSFDAFDSIVELKAANEFPNDAEIVKLVNNQRKANARQKALNVALDAAGIIKPTLENDEQLRLREMFKILQAAGKSEAEARQIASVTLGIEWAE
jgi:hypothetical protein